MRAIVLKNHYEPTASLAYIVRARKCQGIEVSGRISLDLTVGGVNPAAVEWMTKVKGHATGAWSHWTSIPRRKGQAYAPEAALARVAKDGKLVPEVLQVIAIAARNNLVLETGHSSPAEKPPDHQVQKQRGVKHMAIVTHALDESGRPDVDVPKSGGRKIWAQPSNSCTRRSMTPRCSRM